MNRACEIRSSVRNITLLMDFWVLHPVLPPHITHEYLEASSANGHAGELTCLSEGNPDRGRPKGYRLGGSLSVVLDGRRLVCASL